MNYNVTDIVFDFDDDEANTVCNSDLDTFFIASESVRKEVVEDHLGIWEADNEDDLIEEITAAAGWCIKSIDYDIQLEDYSLGNQDDTFIAVSYTHLTLPTRIRV